VPNFAEFTGEDTKTTFEHIRQFLAQASDFGITEVHEITLFPLSLTALHSIGSLALNSIQTWEQLEQKFHEYFYNGETELRLSHLAAVRQKHNESVVDYMRRLRDTRNKCYSLTMSKKILWSLHF
jgi:hypothetical protein